MTTTMIITIIIMDYRYWNDFSLEAFKQNYMIQRKCSEMEMKSFIPNVSLIARLFLKHLPNK